MTMTVPEHIQELFSFLEHPNGEARHLATNYCLQLTTQESQRPFFSTNNYEPLKKLMNLTENPLTQHDQLSALVNLSSSQEYALQIANAQFINALVIQMVLPKNVNADLCCMLLNNLTKQPQAAQMILEKEKWLDNMLELFSKKDFNPKATFDFLGGVFANIAAQPEGHLYFSKASTVDGEIRVIKLLVYTEHENLIRRGGVISTIKNVVFGQQLNQISINTLMEAPGFLASILLPLSGPEEYDEEEMDGMLDELLFLDETKKREQDPQLRLMLVEIVVLMATSIQGRDMLRKIKCYDVVKKLHLQETDEQIQEEIEKLVNLLMRDETKKEQQQTQIVEEVDEKMDSLV